MKTPTIRGVLGALTAGLVALSLTACASSSTGAADSTGSAATSPNAEAATAFAPTLRAGQLGSVKVIEAMLAASGEDKDLPYAIEWSLFPNGGPGLLEAAAGNAVDVGSAADTPAIFALAGGIPVKVIAAKQLPADVSTVEIFAAADSPISSVADLAGKKVALTEGTILQYTVIRALEQAGLTYQDIEVVNLPPADAATAFQSGDVDAVAALDPQRAIIVASGAKKIGDGVGTTTGTSFVLAADAALADPALKATVADYLARLVRAEAWADANPDAWAQKYSDLTTLPLPIATDIVTHDDAQYEPIGDATVQGLQQQADVYADFGILKQPIDVKPVFDTEFNGVIEESAK